MSDNLRTLDPAQGLLVTANHDLFAEGDYPMAQWFPGEFAAGWRARRIRQLLLSQDQWDVEGLHRLQNDIVSPRAQLLLQMEVLRPELNQHPGPTAQTLLAWDGEMSPDSGAPLLFTRLLEQLREEVGGDEARQARLENTPFNSLQLLRLLQGGINERWWDDVETPQVEDRSAIVTRALDHIDSLNLHQAWGEVHQVRFTHPFTRLGLVGRLLEDAFSRGPFPVGGDGSTINAQYFSSRRAFRVTALPSMRFVTEVGNWDNTVLVLPVGESGRPYSSHYDDQLTSWLQGRPLLFPFSEEAVEDAAEARLTLVPASRPDAEGAMAEVQSREFPPPSDKASGLSSA